MLNLIVNITERFVEEYLIDLNATQTATKNLAKPYIAEAIEKAFIEKSRCTDIN